ncbi:MAG: ABC transporter ATP-binding protein [Oscillospiraceae bacterium]|nr:ABC transporter ATP-binding protein [Oscillospiraceae bacterium]
MNAVEMIDIVKEYPGVLANDHVSLTVGQGEIHGLVGENGAGKSTLMNMLYGMTTPDSGEIRIHGERVAIHSPRDAIRHGIGMVHQHFMLAPSLSVLDNIILGNSPRKGVFIDKRRAKEQLTEILERYGFRLDLDAKVYTLSIGQMQRVEIVKVLYRGADVLILDEPTAVLTPQEVEELIATMRLLQRQGTSIIIITHKLKEVMKATDRVTVLRKGRVTGRLETKDTNEHELAERMVGHELNMSIDKGAASRGDTVLELQHLTTLDKRGRTAVDDVSFRVHAGEIVGICGVEGNGQTELVYTVAGMMKQQSGTILLQGEPIQNASVRERRLRGLAHIPEDRLAVGAAPSCTIRENLMLANYFKPPYSRHGVLNGAALEEHAGEMIDRFAIKVPDADYALGTLSGGNMQKVVIAREIDTEPVLLVAAQPTRGVDVGAIMNIRHQLNELRARGMAILLVSAELEEIFALSDRILVMYEGRIVAQRRPEETTENELGLYMAGSREMQPEELADE